MARQSLQEQINAGVREALAAMGFAMPGQRAAAVQTDHIEFGSDEHRQFLGLAIVEKDEEEDEQFPFVKFRSKDTGITYRLEDEIGVVSMYPAMDPDKAALIVLRQKVNELESGPPQVPDNAPSLWQPIDQYTVLVSG